MKGPDIICYANVEASTLDVHHFLFSGPSRLAREGGAISVLGRSGVRRILGLLCFLFLVSLAFFPLWIHVKFGFPIGFYPSHIKILRVMSTG